MKAFFKDTDKLIVNSMTYDEALVGKQFLTNLTGKALKAEQRNDINDDFDGLVLTISDSESQTEEEIQKRIEEAITEYEESKNKEFTVDLNKESKESGFYAITNADNLQVIKDMLASIREHGTPSLVLLVDTDTINTTIGAYGIDNETVPGESNAFALFKGTKGTVEYVCNFDEAHINQLEINVNDPSENQT